LGQYQNSVKYFFYFTALWSRQQLPPRKSFTIRVALEHRAYFTYGITYVFLRRFTIFGFRGV